MRYPRYTFRVSPNVEARIDRLRRQFNCTRSAAIKMLIELGFAALERGPSPRAKASDILSTDGEIPI